jgi:hypothetical protein
MITLICSGLLKRTKLNGQSSTLSLYGSTALWTLAIFFNFFILYTVGRTPWTGDQPVARPLSTHRINADIHASSGIRTHDPSTRTGEDGSCLRLRGHCDRLYSSTDNRKIYSSVTVFRYQSFKKRRQKLKAMLHRPTATA